MSDALELKRYETYLKLELNFSKNSVDAYKSDLIKLSNFLADQNISLQKASRKELEKFIESISLFGLAPRSQARTLSSIRNFYQFLVIEKIITLNPAELLESPKIGKALPEVLEPEEIQKMLDAIDLSRTGGERDKAILELMYSSGPRVSEVIFLETQHLYFDEELVVFTGKGNKQRFVPMGRSAISQLKRYKTHIRDQQAEARGHEKYLFLNNKGRRLSRTHIFTLVKTLAASTGINRNVRPHTLRHSFATSLVERGADLRAVQQMLGHESITTTEIYTHLDRTYLRDVVKEFHPRS